MIKKLHKTAKMAEVLGFFENNAITLTSSLIFIVSVLIFTLRTHVSCLWGRPQIHHGLEMALKW